MLKCENLSFRYNKGGKNVLNSASLELGQGEIGIVLGKNGSGKTTLFKNILGIASPESGSISFEHENLLNMSRRERARKIAYVPQDIQFGALTVFDSILMGRVAYFGLKASHEDYEAVQKSSRTWGSVTMPVGMLTNSPAENGKKLPLQEPWRRNQN